jgi:hypothetical protein
MDSMEEREPTVSSTLSEKQVLFLEELETEDAYQRVCAWPDEWEEIQTLPLGLPTTTRTGSDAELPLAEIAYLPNAVGPIPDAVVVTTGDYVRLFTSQARLAWDVVACTPIEPPKAVIERSFDGLPKDAPSFVPPDLNGPTR